MSLDLYIKSNAPVIKKGTGVYVRKDGPTVELKTIEEIHRHFPDSDLSKISIDKYEDCDFWHGNISHNMGRMASKVPIEGSELTQFDLMWQPDEHGIVKTGSSGYRNNVLKEFLYMRGNREDLSLLNPENGWGDYDQLLEFTEDYILHLIRAEDDFKIEASR